MPGHIPKSVAKEWLGHATVPAVSKETRLMHRTLETHGSFHIGPAFIHEWWHEPKSGSRVMTGRDACPTGFFAPEGRGVGVKRAFLGAARLVEIRLAGLELPGDRLAGKVHADVSGPDAEAQMSAEFGVGGANRSQGGLDCLGHRQADPFGV